MRRNSRLPAADPYFISAFHALCFPCATALAHWQQLSVESARTNRRYACRSTNDAGTQADRGSEHAMSAPMPVPGSGGRLPEEAEPRHCGQPLAGAGVAGYRIRQHANCGAGRRPADAAMGASCDECGRDDRKAGTGRDLPREGALAGRQNLLRLCGRDKRVSVLSTNRPHFAG